MICSKTHVPNTNNFPSSSLPFLLPAKHHSPVLRQLKSLNTWVSNPLFLHPTPSLSTLEGLTANQSPIPTGCTAKAVQHQLTALRKELDTVKSTHFADAAGGASSGSANGSTPATPTAKGSAKKRKSKDENATEEAANDAGDVTPSKKVKGTPKAGKASAKRGSPRKKKVEPEAEAENEKSDEAEGQDCDDNIDENADGDDDVAARKDAAEGRETEKVAEEDA